MFDRFTEKSIKVIMLAQEESRRLGHQFVGTEQILLGLIREGTGVAAKVLRSFSVNLSDARLEVENIIGRSSDVPPIEIPFTPRGKLVLKLSWDEAKELGQNWIGTEHLLLGLIRTDAGIAVRVLEKLGVDLSKLRETVINAIVRPNEEPEPDVVYRDHILSVLLELSEAAEQVQGLESTLSNLLEMLKVAIGHRSPAVQDRLDALADKLLQLEYSLVPERMASWRTLIAGAMADIPEIRSPARESGETEAEPDKSV
jgi:ATP-dependent Clp protease ATP-binding subunit ClpA